MCRNVKVNGRLWNNSLFYALSDKAKLAYFFIATHPHMTAIGAMRGTHQGLAAELGWSLAAFRKAFHELLGAGLVRWAEKAPLIWMPCYLEDNRPESPNVVKSWAAIVDQLPECRELVDVLVGVQVFAKSWGETFFKALPQAIRQVIPLPASAQPPASNRRMIPQPDDRFEKAMPKPSVCEPHGVAKQAHLADASGISSGDLPTLAPTEIRPSSMSGGCCPIRLRSNCLVADWPP